MPTWTVEAISGVRFEIRPKEGGHNIPHVHVYYAGQNVSIAFDGGILAGGINPKKQKKAVTWIEENRQEVEKRWKEVHPN